MSSNVTKTTSVTVRARHDKDNPYFLQRRDTAQDRSMSYEARGLLTYVLSKPDNWSITVPDLMQKGCGRDKVYSILNELIAHRYATRKRLVDNKGRVVKWEITLYESPLPEKPDQAQPDQENQDANKLQSPENPESDSVPAPAGRPRQRDPLFDWIADKIASLNPEQASEDKDLGGYIGSLKKSVVDAEKHLLQVESLDRADLARLAAEMPGFERWYHEKYQDAALPQSKVLWKKHVLAWFNAGKPYSKPKPARKKHDLNCPLCGGLGQREIRPGEWINCEGVNP